MVIVLVLLIVVVAIAVFIWNYRRQTAAREAASAERMKAFLDSARATTGNPAQTPATAHSPAAQPAARPTAATARPRPQVSGFSARAHLMSAEQAAFYALLKGALPEHEVFVRMSLAAFIEPADNLTGFAREAQERRLADAMVDFLVCDKTLKSIAAVQCGASVTQGGKTAEIAAFAAACVESTGLRWVEVRPQPLPSREDLRQRVLGV